MFTAPKSRYRLYTRASSYTTFVRDVLTGRYGSGSDVEDLEGRIAREWGVRNVVALPMARVGVHLAIKTMVMPGKNVIMSPYTIADVVNMVIGAGGRPIFADVQPETCNIDPLEVERLIDRSTGAVLVTHLHGLAADTSKIHEICRSHDVPLIEDAAQAFGARASGHRVGTAGDVGVFSFGTYKNISCWYGGLLVTSDDSVADKVRHELQDCDYQSPGFLRKKVTFGLMTDILTSPLIFSTLTYWIFRYGALRDIDRINRFVLTELDIERRDELPENYLARLSPFQARLAMSQLGRIDQDSDRRIEAARQYYEGLRELPGIRLPPKRQDRSHIYTYFAIQHDNAAGLLKWLMHRKRDVGAQHLKNCADLEAFAEFRRDCPNARAAAKSVVLLPTYPRYDDDEVKKTIAAVADYEQQPAHRQTVEFGS